LQSTADEDVKYDRRRETDREGPEGGGMEPLSVAGARVNRPGRAPEGTGAGVEKVGRRATGTPGPSA